MGLDCSVTVHDQYYLMRIDGELTAANCAHVLETINQHITSVEKPLICDLEQMAYIDSRGLGTLVTLFTHMKKAGQSFQLIKVRPDVEKIIRMTALHTIFSLHPSLESALHELHGI